MQLQCRMRIFGYRLYRDTTDLKQRPTLNDCARTAEKSRIPKVITILQQTMKQHVFRRLAVFHAEVAAKGVRREKMVRRLHYGTLRVFQKPAHG